MSSGFIAAAEFFRSKMNSLRCRNPLLPRAVRQGVSFELRGIEGIRLEQGTRVVGASSARSFDTTAAATDMPSEQLIARVASGDRAAFSQLYDRHAPRVLGLLVRSLRHRADAEDVLQETFHQIWRSANQYSANRSSPEVWVTLIARSRAVGFCAAETPRRDGLAHTGRGAALRSFGRHGSGRSGRRHSLGSRATAPRNRE